MLAYTYIEQGKFELLEKQRPQIKDSRDAIVRVTLSSICTSDLHIKHGQCPPGSTRNNSRARNGGYRRRDRY